MAKQTINIIAAIGKNRELGKDGKLLWHIKNDMMRFKTLTIGHPIIMGRKTFESIGKPLPNRTNIVVTRNPDYKIDGVISAPSLEEALKKASELGEEAFVIGGGELYTQALPLANKLYLTIIDDTKEADTFFPEYSEFKTILSEEKHVEEILYYTFLELTK